MEFMVLHINYREGFMGKILKFIDNKKEKVRNKKINKYIKTKNNEYSFVFKGRFYRGK